jgi:DNA polymerase III epsilon subunit-like protein
MILFLDTETTGLVQKDLPPDHRSQAHLVEIAAQLWDGDRMMQALSLIIDPGDVDFSPGAIATHGITAERAKAEGVAPQIALRVFDKMASLADEWVAHNASFEVEILRLAYCREGWVLPEKKITCTMQLATPLTKIDGGTRGWKWPKLEEAYRYFYPDRPFEYAHSAYYDCTYCREIWTAMRDRGLLP